MTSNISKFTDYQTAHTCLACAKQRAENLSLFGVESVLELCVGPSLQDLEQCYSDFGITVAGNDIDPRWQNFYPRGKWLVGDAVVVGQKHGSTFDAVVVAPPLSKGCSGRREDALSVEEVTPSFYSFLGIPAKKVVTYVLPGKTLSLKRDRSELFKFLSKIDSIGEVHVIPLKNKVTKYVDVYVVKAT